MLSSIDDLVPLVMVDVPGATKDAVRVFISQAVRLFCMETEAWRQELYLDTVADQADYTITVSGDGNVHRVISMKQRTSTSEAFDYIQDVDSSRWYLSGINTFTFRPGYEPASAVTTGVRLVCVIRPNLNCEYIESDLMDRWAEGIAAGAKSLMMLSPGKPFSNPGLAQIHKAIYDKARSAAILERYQTFGPDNMIVAQLGGLV